MVEKHLLVGLLITLGTLSLILAETDQNGVIYYNTVNTTKGNTLYNNIQDVLNYLVNATHLPNGTYYCNGTSPDDVCGISICYNSISSGDCTKCLRTAKSYFQQIAPLAIGARYTDLNCRLHYENGPFNDNDYNAPYLAPPPSISPSLAPSTSSPPFLAPSTRSSPPSSPPSLVLSPPYLAPAPGKKGQQTWKIAAIIVAAGCFMVIVILSTYLIRRKRSKTVEITREHGSLEDAAMLFSYEDLKSATNNFNETNIIGRGGFGEVYKGVLQDGTEVAIKQLSLQSVQGKQSFLNEVKIIRSVQHRNLVKLRGYCTEEEHYVLVYEYMKNGSLEEVLHREDVLLDWKTRWNIALRVACGLAYLHEESQQGIIHRDIKSSNILLDSSFQPKISDFGVSKLFEHDQSITGTLLAGTYGYLAPEYVMRGMLSIKVDVFSFGILLLEIISGRKCQEHALQPVYILDWVWGLYENGSSDIIDHKLGKSYSKSEATKLIHLALLCTQDEPEERPSMSLVVAILRGYANQPDVSPKKPQLWRNILVQTVNNSKGSSNRNMFTTSKVSYDSFEAR